MFGPLAVDDADGAVDPVPTAGKQRQALACLRLVGGLGQHPAPAGDDRIGAQHHVAGIAPGDALGLGQGQALGQIAGAFAGLGFFVDVGGDHLVGDDADLGQQVEPPG